MVRRSSMARPATLVLLIGGPLYLIYVYLALFTPLGAGAAPLH